MIELESVSFRYEKLLMFFNLVVPEGSLTAVLGPSGAGKSTLLSLIAGFESPLRGTVRIAGEVQNDHPPDRRPVSMIFQDHNVFGHLDLWENVAVGISSNLKLNSEQRKKVDQALDEVGLLALRERKPGQVSGGERQRVAIARALVRDKPVLLLDEPFAALGPALRRDMLDLIMAMQRERRMTVLMVTHQPEDAIRAASHTAYLEDGRILAMDTTAGLFARRDLPQFAVYLGG